MYEGFPKPIKFHGCCFTSCTAKGPENNDKRLIIGPLKQSEFFLHLKAYDVQMFS